MSTTPAWRVWNDISSDSRLTRRAAAELGYRTGRDDTWHRSDRDATRAIPWTRSLLQLEPYPGRGFSTEAGSDTRTGERHMRDSAGRGGGLDVVILLEALQSVPEAYASAEQDRDHHRVHVVDEPGREELANHGGTAPDAYVPAARSLARRLERLGRRGVDEVERRTALHLDRRACVMRENEDRCVERRVGTPGALPLRVLVPSGVAELPGTHDLRADPGREQLRERVVDAAGAAGPADHLAPPPGGEHPFVQPFAGVTEMCMGALTLTGAEAVE